ncbi:MAG: peptide deformylase [Bacteroidetes bacterium]|nr:peptide deformylase [Bacteroidota bacterium]
MILPITQYGDAVLRKLCTPITPDYPNLKVLIANMFETMYNASGVGLAAPQIALPIRLFVIDAEPLDEINLKGFKKVFINAQILEEKGDKWAYNEGCLSIPGIREDINRKEQITITYVDENFVQYTETYNSKIARVIQHEYDHIEGKLFVDYLTPLKKEMLKGRLADITKGRADVDYKVKLPKR